MTMFSRHVSRELAAYIDGELASGKARRVELHLAECQRCGEEREQVQFGMSALDRLPAAQAPDAVWTSIEAAIPRHRPRGAPAVRRWRPALAALVIVGVAGAAFWKLP